MVRRTFQTKDRLTRFHRVYRWIEASCGILGFLAFVLLLGAAPWWGVDGAWLIALECVALAGLLVRIPATLMFAPSGRERLTRALLHHIVLLILIALAVWELVASSPFPWSWILHIGVLAYGTLWLFYALREMQQLALSPLLLFAGSYLVLILVGAGLLMLPAVPARADMATLDFVQALFMSTSAACVTGLSLFDVGSDFSLFGQLTLMVLFQIGGLGIMTFAAFAVVASGSGMSLRDRVALGEVLNYHRVGRVGRVVLWIVLITLISEAAGTAMLYGEWVGRDGVPLATAEQFYYSVFHSISAFCNAGFSLQTDSLTMYGQNATVMLSIASLIIIGGLGFAVIIDLLRYRPWAHPAARRLPWIGRKLRRMPLPRLTLQTKLVLVMALVLTLGGTLAIWWLERDATLAGMSFEDGLLSAFFHGGVTPRTAGFNAIDYGQMQPESQLLTMVLMVIGASPGSTAGGIKVTAAAVLILAILNTLRGRPVEVFRRRISDEQIYRVLVVLVVGLTVIGSAFFTLLVIDGDLLKQGRWGFNDLAFEAISAFGTVGLSTGVTGDLSPGSHVVLSACMFMGRIGPLTLILALGRSSAGRFQYPEEPVMLG